MHWQHMLQQQYSAAPGGLLKRVKTRWSTIAAYFCYWLTTSRLPLHNTSGEAASTKGNYLSMLCWARLLHDVAATHSLKRPCNTDGTSRDNAAIQQDPHVVVG
jgi:hypothetical protein